MTSALNGGGWSASRPDRLYPRERHGTHCTGGWVGFRSGLDRCGKSRPHRDSIPGPSRREERERIKWKGRKSKENTAMYRPCARDVQLNGKMLWEYEQRILWLLMDCKPTNKEAASCLEQLRRMTKRLKTEDSGLLGCEAASLYTFRPTFRRNVSPSTSKSQDTGTNLFEALNM
jgi:hypothetical protein